MCEFFYTHFTNKDWTFEYGPLQVKCRNDPTAMVMALVTPIIFTLYRNECMLLVRQSWVWENVVLDCTIDLMINLDRTPYTVEVSHLIVGQWKV